MIEQVQQLLAVALDLRWVSEKIFESIILLLDLVRVVELVDISVKVRLPSLTPNKAP